MKTRPFARLAGIAAIPLLTMPAFAQTITKCQDADGNWHYGNYATAVCGDRPITELRESGITLEVREAPPTVEELQAQKAREQAERDAQIQREEKRRVDQALLQKFSSEDVIVQLRDQRLAELEKQIGFNQRELAKLRAEREALGEPSTEIGRQELHEMSQRIERFERAVERGEVAMLDTREDYAKLLERYRQIGAPE